MIGETSWGKSQMTARIAYELRDTWSIRMCRKTIKWLCFAFAKHSRGVVSETGVQSVAGGDFLRRSNTLISGCYSPGTIYSIVEKSPSGYASPVFFAFPPPAVGRFRGLKPSASQHSYSRLHVTQNTCQWTRAGSRQSHIYDSGVDVEMLPRRRQC